jgi:ribonuclease R
LLGGILLKDYIDYVLKKEKKPVEIEKIYKVIEEKKKQVDPKYVLSDSDINEIDRILSEGIECFEYYKTPKGRYTLISKTSFRKGSFHGNRIGGGTVYSTTTCIKKDWTREVRDEKFAIDSENCGSAVDGDIVLIDIGNGNGKKNSIIKVLERNIGEISGEVTKIGNNTYLKPFDKKKNSLTIYLNGDYEEGSVVSASLNELTEEDLEKLKETTENHYIGEVKRVVPNEGPFHKTLIEAFKCGMPQGFSDESLKQAENISSVVLEKDRTSNGRKDITSLDVFTIDGEDTKDKDDAVSLEITPDGHYLLEVHIADVPYYVKEGTPIDLDAFRKGNSYYYGGLVEHQLPPKLSNGICSLNEGVERLTKSIFMELDQEGNVLGKWLKPTVIRSRKSLTYEKVNELLRGVDVEGYKPFKDNLEAMSILAHQLQKKRLYGGAIIFNRPEVRFKHDEMGNPTEVTLRYGNSKAETIISEFMLLANHCVADIMEENNIPFVYRVHGLPKVDKLSDFLKLLKALNMPFEFDEEDILKDKKCLQLLAVHISKNAKSIELSDMLNATLIKCMSHASYSSVNIGHYGTGFDKYCHFTSPIRRIADLANSRIIDECYFEQNASIRDKNIKKWTNRVNDYALQASLMEKVAEEVEKNVLYMDTAQYLGKYVGQEFEGTIITLSDKGICVQIEDLLEGKIRNRYLDGDYIYNPETYTLVSLSGKCNYYLGDQLRLKLIGTSTDTKSVDFEVLEKIKENNIRDRHHSNQYVKSKAQDNRNRRPYN